MINRIADLSANGDNVLAGFLQYFLEKMKVNLARDDLTSKAGQCFRRKCHALGTSKPFCFLLGINF